MSTTPPILQITPAAATKIREVIAQQALTGTYALRVGVKGAAMGCAGVSYLLGFDNPQPTDILADIQGIPVVIDPKHSMFVMGMEIDWHEDEHQRGFVFNNPTKRESA